MSTLRSFLETVKDLRLDLRFVESAFYDFIKPRAFELAKQLHNHNAAQSLFLHPDRFCLFNRQILSWDLELEHMQPRIHLSQSNEMIVLIVKCCYDQYTSCEFPISFFEVEAPLNELVNIDEFGNQGTDIPFM